MLHIGFRHHDDAIGGAGANCIVFCKIFRRRKGAAVRFLQHNLNDTLCLTPLIGPEKRRELFNYFLSWRPGTITLGLVFGGLSHIRLRIETEPASCPPQRPSSRQQPCRPQSAAWYSKD